MARKTALLIVSGLTSYSEFYGDLKWRKRSKKMRIFYTRVCHGLMMMMVVVVVVVVVIAMMMKMMMTKMMTTAKMEFRVCDNPPLPSSLPDNVPTV